MFNEGIACKMRHLLARGGTIPFYAYPDLELKSHKTEVEVNPQLKSAPIPVGVYPVIEQYRI